jgi:hypothetical protein
MEKAVEKGQEINVKFKHNQGVSPNSKEALEKDLIDPENESDSDQEDSNEWRAREHESED